MNVKQQKIGYSIKVYFQTNNFEKRNLGEDPCLISTPQFNYFLRMEGKSLSGLDFSDIFEILHYEFYCSTKRVISSFSTSNILKLHILNVKI